MIGHNYAHLKSGAFSLDMSIASTALGGAFRVNSACFFFHAFVVVCLLFKIKFFKKLFQEQYQTVCKSYQQTKVATIKERVNLPHTTSQFENTCLKLCAEMSKIVDTE